MYILYPARFCSLAGLSFRLRGGDRGGDTSAARRAHSDTQRPSFWDDGDLCGGSLPFARWGACALGSIELRPANGVLASPDSLCKGFLGPRLRMLELYLRILYLRL